MDNDSPTAYAFDLASKIDGTKNFNKDTRALFDFLQSVDARKIDEASKRTLIERPLPVIEKDVPGAFLTKGSYELLEAGDFIKVPIIVGTTSEEDLFSVKSVNDYNTRFADYEKNHLRFIPSKGFHAKDGANQTAIADVIYQNYFENVASPDRLGHFLKYNSDNKYSKAMIKHADLASRFTDVYFYIFSHDGPMGDWNTTVQGADAVGHGEDDRYLWKVTSRDYFNGDQSKFPKADQIVHERVITMWTNFAKFVNPTPEASPELQNVIWPKVTSGNFQYLDIGTDLTIKKDPKSPHYAMWTKLYDTYNKRPFTIF